jgi:predicted nuclease with RNAse H fold
MKDPMKAAMIPMTMVSQIPRSRVRWRSVDAELARVGPSLLPTSAGV